MGETGFVLIFIAVVGLLLGMRGIAEYFRDRKREFVIIPGRITGFRKSTDRRNRVTFYPVFEYYLDGVIYQSEGRVGTVTMKDGTLSEFSSFEVGDDIEVRVFTDEPSKGIINKNIDVNMSLYIGLCGIGAFIVCTAAVVLMLLL